MAAAEDDGVGGVTAYGVGDEVEGGDGGINAAPECSCEVGARVCGVATRWPDTITTVSTPGTTSVAVGDVDAGWRADCWKGNCSSSNTICRELITRRVSRS